MAFYNIVSGVLRGLGDSISALYYLLIATVINIILDIVFVAYFNMGVSGVAIATVISQFACSILTIRKLLSKKELFTLNKESFNLRGGYARKIIKLGLPSGLTQLIFSMSLVLVQSLTNSFGELVIAANVIIMRVDGFAMMPNVSFSTAMTTFAGQNVGAKKYDRLFVGARQGTFLAIGVSSVITLILLAFGKDIMHLFTDTNELINFSYKFMTYISFGYVVFAITQALSGVLRGAGDTVSPMWISIITSVIIRVCLAYILVYFTKSEANPNGIPEVLYISLLLSWISGSILTMLVYRFGNWRKKYLLNNV